MVHVYDVLILGGGPAGLAMAVTLARQVYSALVIDSGVYRNERATNMHNVPGFDHVPPAEYRAKVRKDLAARYQSIEFQDGTTIVQVRRRTGTANYSAKEGESGCGDADELANARFEAVDSDGNVYYGRKLGLATGVRDKVEDEVDGFADCWGRGVFHCLFCDGFEERGAASAGVLGVGMYAPAAFLAHVGLLAKRLSSHLTLYTDGDAGLPAALPPSHLSADKITIETRKIAKLAMKNYPAESTVVVLFEDGSTREEGFLSGHPFMAQAAPFAEQLGLEMKNDAGGPLIVLKNGMGETSVPGCFAAGDAAVAIKGVVQATYTGSMAGLGLAKEVMHDLEEKNEL